MANRRLLELDALRGIAAFTVVLYHYLTLYHKKYGHGFEPFEGFSYGYLGVHLFFIISGFVIFWTLNRSSSLADFAVSRMSRLYPAFWAAVLLTFVFVNLVGPADRAVSLETFLVNLTMFQEFLGEPHVDGVYWTLSIELMFYILAATAMGFGLLKAVDWMCVAWLLLALTVKAFALNVSYFEQILLLEYCHLFIAGIAFYRLWSGSWSWLTLVVLALSLSANWLHYNLAEAAIVSGIYGVVWLAVQGWLRFIAVKPLLYLGSISYSLYLVHQNLGYGLIQTAYQYGVHPFVAIALALAVSLATAHLITSRIEQPCLTVVRRWWRSRESAAVTAAAES